MEKNNKRKTLHTILIGWERYDPELSPEENLIELIIDMGFLDEAQMLIERYKRRRYK
jgi:hypothetical protein